MDAHRERKQRLPVHEVRGQFEGKEAVFRVTSVTGHVYSVDFPPEFQSWKTDPALLFNAPIVKKGDAKVCKHLQKEANGCDTLILWLDCDREGENICFEVMENCVPHLRGRKRVLRAKFSALTEVDVRRAMATLGQPNENEAKAVDCRQILDLKIGVAFTRFQTNFFSDKYGDLDSRLVSYGPCQTPTLWFCVQRMSEINAFVPEPFWRLDVTVDLDSVVVPLDWSRQRVFKKEVGELFQADINGEKQAFVTKVEKKPKKKTRPIALNTVELLRAASRIYGMSPAQTMHDAEALYIRGYLSYPRTESTAYPKTFDFEGALRPHVKHEIWGTYVSSLLEIGLTPPRGGSDQGDHPPITPLRAATEAELGGALYRVYEYVTRHFIATVSPDCSYDSHKVSWRVGQETFTSTTINVIQQGYTLILAHEAVRSNITSAAPVVNRGYKILTVQLTAGETSPPEPLTESDLITKMEQNGIGTDASIPVHINNICERNYVKVVGHARHLVPTRLGVALINGIARIDKQLCAPLVRSQVERYLDAIAKGEATFDAVLKHTLDIFVDKFNFFRDHISAMDQLFEASFSSLVTTAGMSKSLSRCGKCHKFMKLIHKAPARLFCEHCNETYSLPPGGSIKLYLEHVCPLDGFQLVIWRSGQGEQAKTLIVCPMCYNAPPIELAPGAKGMPCSSCTIPTCPHSLVRQAIMPCLAEPPCQGTIVLDPISGPKWKASCNTCNYCIFLPENAHKISLVPDSACPECGSSIMEVDFNKNSMPAALNGVSLRRGCPMCDEIINSNCRVGHTKQTFGRRQWKGRGKGGGAGKKGGRNNRDAKMSFDRF